MPTALTELTELAALARGDVTPVLVASTEACIGAQPQSRSDRVIEPEVVY